MFTKSLAIDSRACDSWAASACSGEEFYREHEGKRYCVLHFPGEAKQKDFEEALRRKLNNNDFDFRGVWFPGPANFAYVEFTVAADFVLATFSALANFYRCKFNEGAYFSAAVFGREVNFSQANFNAGANFSEATFSDSADFSFAGFKGELDFAQASFNGATHFYGATFGDHVRFAGSEGHSVFSNDSLLDLQFVRIEKPDHIVFHTLTARPVWFVNVDARKFEFTNVDWDWRLQEAIVDVTAKKVSAPHNMLSIACRNLAVNAEDNHRYEGASKFRYMAMDARRLEHWGGFGFWRLSWWYWLASGYGERIWRAGLVLLGILLVSALVYTRVGFARWEPRVSSESEAMLAQRDEVGAPLELSRAFTYSAAVMTFQRPEPRPATTAAQTIVLLETILGPVQAALLALAIRRKFMR